MPQHINPRGAAKRATCREYVSRLNEASRFYTDIAASSYTHVKCARRKRQCNIVRARVHQRVKPIVSCGLSCTYFQVASVLLLSIFYFILYLTLSKFYVIVSNFDIIWSKIQLCQTLIYTKYGQTIAYAGNDIFLRTTFSVTA